MMRKFVSLLCAGVLASATVIAPISTAPALADGDAGVRAYFTFKFGSGEPVKNRTQYGFQLNQSWDSGDEAIDPFAVSISRNVIDFAFNADGLARANVMGLDVIRISDILNGNDRFNQNGGDGTGGNGVLIFGGIFTGLGIACVAFDLWPCDNDNGGPKCTNVTFGVSSTCCVTTDYRMSADSMYADRMYADRLYAACPET